MDGRQKIALATVTVSLVLFAWAGALWLGHGSAGKGAAGGGLPAGARTQPAALRLGIIPERDIYEQRKRFGVLTAYLAGELKRPVELATLNTYEGVLRDLQEGQIDGAFVGSLAAVLAHDRLGARVVANPEYPGGVHTYRGMIFVRQDSPVLGIEDLQDRSIAMVRTTTAGTLFPIYTFQQAKMLDGPRPPIFRWVGTHDDVISAVVEGQVDSGAAKDLRVEDWERKHPEIKLRVLALSDPVPEMALVLRPGLDAAEAERVVKSLLAMRDRPEGREALAAFGAERFRSCAIEQFAPVYRMAEAIGPAWELVGLGEPRPKRPESQK